MQSGGATDCSRARARSLRSDHITTHTELIIKSHNAPRLFGVCSACLFAPLHFYLFVWIDHDYGSLLGRARCAAPALLRFWPTRPGAGQKSLGSLARIPLPTFCEKFLNHQRTRKNYCVGNSVAGVVMLSFQMMNKRLSD